MNDKLKLPRSTVRATMLLAGLGSILGYSSKKNPRKGYKFDKETKNPDEKEFKNEKIPSIFNFPEIDIPLDKYKFSYYPKMQEVYDRTHTQRMTRLTEFKKQIESIHPKERKGFIESFYINAIKNSEFTQDFDYLQSCTALLKEHGFESHAKKIEGKYKSVLNRHKSDNTDKFYYNFLPVLVRKKTTDEHLSSLEKIINTPALEKIVSKPVYELKGHGGFILVNPKSKEEYFVSDSEKNFEKTNLKEVYRN